MLYFLQKFLVKFLRFWVWLAIKLEAWLRPGSLLLEMICWSGCRKITVDSSMLFTELETLIEPSSTMAFNCDIYWAFVSEVGCFGWTIYLVVLLGFTLSVSGWRCWGNETFQRRSTPLLLSGLALKNLILLWSWYTVTSHIR